MGPESAYRNSVRPVSDQELSSLIAAGGNSEAKILTFFSMEPDIIYAGPDLYFSLMALQGARPGWRMGSGVPFDWCEDSLAPVGLVTQEVLDSNLNTMGYIKARYGEEVGTPLFGLLADISSRQERVALYNLFGATQSGFQITSAPIEEGVDDKKRSPATRINIFRALSHLSSPLREADLAIESGEDRVTLRDHLPTLSRFGLLQYDSVNQGTPVTVYSLRDERPPVLPSRYTKGSLLHTQQIYEHLLAGGAEKRWRLDEIIKIVDPDDPTLNRLRSEVSGTLAHLERTGYVEMGQFHYNKYSEIEFTESQQMLFREITNTLSRFQAGDREIWQYGIEQAAYIRNHPEIVARLMEKARIASPSANRQNSRDTESIIRSIVHDNPEINTTGVFEIFQSVNTRALTRTRIEQLLTSLKRKRLIASKKSKSANVWSDVPTRVSI